VGNRFAFRFDFARLSVPAGSSIKALADGKYSKTYFSGYFQAAK
jgi:hypothetical protein